MTKIDSKPRTLQSWEEELLPSEEELLPSEVEALHDWYHSDPNELLTPSEVLECIVSWNGGIASAYHIKSIISRVYGIEL